MAEKIDIIGIGDEGLEGLTSGARDRINRADLIIGAEKSLACLESVQAEKLDLGGDFEQMVQRLQAVDQQKVVILALGDPLFYGTARYLCDRLGKDRFEVVPHVSVMQLAFARVKESWDEAYLTNLATQSLERVVEKIRTAERVGLFTTEQATPAEVARALLERKIDYFSAYVCENLGSPDERVTHAELKELAEQSFDPLNVMILVRKPDTPERAVERTRHRRFGNPDEAFLQSKPKRGLLTPAEVRTMALAEMDVQPDSVIWDVGAGSGSVAIEAAQLAPQGHVYAIEMAAEDYQLIVENAARFGVENLTPILGQAPDAWSTLPDPDAIFVDGTGRTIGQICEFAYQRLRPGGTLFANLGSVEHVSTIRNGLDQLGGEVNIWMINVARGNFQMDNIRFESLNPTFLVAARKA